MTKEPWWVYLLAGVLLVLLMGAYAACSQALYGDWRCAFSECRIEVKK